MANLSGKTAVVTGGNSGIGYATAARLKADGATVFITGRNQGRVEEAAEALGVTGLVADVTSLDAIQQTVDKVKHHAGTVDILFINAGVFFGAPVGQLDEKTFDNIMDINFKGAVFTLEKFLPILNDGASIINLSSINSYMGMTGTSIYGASKAALDAYTRVAAKELASRGIRVNTVNPGPVNTPIFGKTGMPEEAVNGLAGAIQSNIPLGRFGEPKEIANLVAFLASDEATWITGSDYVIDGGAVLRSLSEAVAN